MMTLSPFSFPNGTQTLQFDALSHAPLVHGVLLRHGGVSPPPWESLNVGLAVGDDPPRVAENRRRIREALGLPALVAARQVHDDRVAVVIEDPGQEIDGVDALITNVAGLGLMIQQADCQAVLLHDPVRRAVGIAHSGWRGSVANIIAKTVAAMTDAYSTDPADLLAGVSPSLGPCCGEFVNFRTELPPAFHSFQVRPNHFDFWAVSRAQLVAAGVGPEKIAVASLCTVCDQRFFSFRRQKSTGRFASVIGLRP